MKMVSYLLFALGCTVILVFGLYVYKNRSQGSLDLSNTVREGWNSRRSFQADTDSEKKVNGSINEISGYDLSQIMRQQEDVKLINVLSEEAFQDCHIKGSLHIPLSDIPTAVKDWSRDEKIVVYCASRACSASKKAAKQLMKMGFRNVRAYEGGMKDWLKESLGDVNGDCKMGYLR